jgi:hypothetical protein
MNCRETRPLLPLFFDGELEARQMRAVALHSTRCSDCEGALRRLERLQDVLAAEVSAELDGIDLGRVWTGVASRLDVTRGRGVLGWKRWWEMPDLRWIRPAPTLAALAAACLLAVFLWQWNAARPPAELASTDNSAILDSVESNVGSLAVLREPETNTMVLWITDGEPLSNDIEGVP